MKGIFPGDRFAGGFERVALALLQMLALTGGYFLVKKAPPATGAVPRSGADQKE